MPFKKVLEEAKFLSLPLAKVCLYAVYSGEWSPFSSWLLDVCERAKTLVFPAR